MTAETYFQNVHNRRSSGTGILEFSPAKAGQDITPANYSFPKKPGKKKSSIPSSLAGMYAFRVFMNEI